MEGREFIYNDGASPKKYRLRMQIFQQAKDRK